MLKLGKLFTKSLFIVATLTLCNSSDGFSKEVPKTETKTFQDWKLVKKTETENNFPVEEIDIYHKDKKVGSFKDARLEVQFFGNAPITKDKNTPYFVLHTYSGGAHCCSTVKIFALKEPFQEVAKHEIQGVPPIWKDVNKDGVKEAIIGDYTFDYWHAPHAGSAIPEVILSFNGKDLVVDGKLMKKPAPVKAKFMAEANKIKNEIDLWQYLGKDDYPGAITQKAVELVYSGHSDLVEPFVKAAWNPQYGTPDQFLKDFKVQLEKSPYWQDLKKQGFKDLG